ncbi:MAG: thiamine phosphate synthase, partial [Sphingobacteriales bacterium]
RLLEEQPIETPVIAVGGIQLTDVEPLLATGGIYGIAVSAAVNKAIDPGRAVKEFYKKLH